MRRIAARAGAAWAIITVTACQPFTDESPNDLALADETRHVRVMTSGGFAAAYDLLAPRFEELTGVRLETAYGASSGGASDSIPSRLSRGELADVIILSESSLDDLTQSGIVQPDSRVDLVHSSIGIAVRRGAPRPDITSKEAFVETVLAAESIGYSASASGTYLSTILFPSLGIWDQIEAKSRRVVSERVASVVARGEVEIGFQQISEILSIEGAEYVGPLPGSLQKVTTFSAGVLDRAQNPEDARRLLDYLSSEDVAETIRMTGLSPVVEAATAQSETFDIYWVDVEGGAATLAVSPTGESLLVDTGWGTDDDRDAKRIVAIAEEAGLTKIDHLVMTHFHADHVGGLQALARMIPIERCFDHGTNTEESNQRWVDAYLSVCGDKRTALEAGEKITFGPVEIDVIASNGQLISSAVNDGGANTLCATAELKAQASPENQRSIGALFTYGRFTFLDLGDFNWAKEIELSCPNNKVGEVTLYQTSRHGAWDDAGSPTHLYAIKPQVIVVNNGPRKGLGGTSPGFSEVSTAHYDRMAESPGVEGIWQGHRSLLDPDPAHNTSEEMIANLEESAECQGHWIRASVRQDGTFTVTNGRNGFTQTYTAR